MTVELKQPRNLRFFRLYWALVTLVWKHLDEKRAALYPTADDLSDALKIAVGLRKTIIMPDGEVICRPGSIAWDKQSEDEFAAFYELISDLLAKHWLPGVTSEQLRQEVASMIGAAA